MNDHDRWLDDDRPTVAQLQSEDVARREADAFRAGQADACHNLVDVLGPEAIRPALELLEGEFAAVARSVLSGYTHDLMEAAHG